MRKAYVVAKGTPAEVAAQAAVHGLYLVDGYEEVPQGSTVIEKYPCVRGYVQTNEGADSYLEQRILRWYTEPDVVPFKPGTLLQYQLPV